MNDTLLIELRSEELPPKSLKLLSEAFADAVFSALKAQQFAADDSVCTSYATPRRLAMTITGMAGRQPDRVLEKKMCIRDSDERALPFGKTVLLFDGAPSGVTRAQLAALGETRNPGLADLFVATMKGTYV